ncbi:unnamed protein product [Closterium sp. NIES-64]|nr:unnamed protein product [Closterium sp. NIES-64]CAI6006536.1 unnamed protein product [Closterium sp. NIES-64]
MPALHYSLHVAVISAAVPSTTKAKLVVVGGGGVSPWSEWRMRVWKKPVLRVGDTLVFKWWGFPNDVVAALIKKQFDTCNFTLAIMLHSTTWVGRYKFAIPSGTTRVLFASSMRQRCLRGLKYDTGAILP